VGRGGFRGGGWGVLGVGSGGGWGDLGVRGWEVRGI